MTIDHSTQLSSSEIAVLWGGYIENTMSRCVLTYFDSIIEDQDFKPVIEQALTISNRNVKQIKEILTTEQIPVPYGFSDSDINVQAPRLYSDTFMVRYILFMGRSGEITNAFAHGTSGREDIRALFFSHLKSSATLYDQAANVMLKKGTFVRSPYIVYPTQNEYVEKENFLAGFIGEKRPLTAMEIAHIATNVESNSVGTTLLTGFAQTAQSNEIKKYLARGFEIGKKQMEILDKVLTDDNTASPKTWDGVVEASTSSPFSDKLMMQHVVTMNSQSLGSYGQSLGGSPRRDIASHYARFIVEVGNYANDGAEIMITNGWMEKPPHTVDRQKTMKPN
ncbi:DUF3231 family protein [Aquibacillus halophilus]|uniref:DUF3231 family protein n=1 Tax=Aquibacillus halophilus TaxID=930132 RepID=A0A6A8DF87_9BACI|nr:DUF3231 family protein [Aquibacillus halophilus]MRH43890.1 DUF3231 family protein [Aquibacillus halophilus]